MKAYFVFVLMVCMIGLSVEDRRDNRIRIPIRLPIRIPRPRPPGGGSPTTSAPVPVQCQTIRCTAETQCGCQVACPATCDNPNPPTCPTFACNAGCYKVCPSGQVLTREGGNCTTLENCSVIAKSYQTRVNGACVGGVHDRYYSSNGSDITCASACPRICGQPEQQFCITLCVSDVCQCEAGYYRRVSDGQCVLQQDCSSY